MLMPVCIWGDVSHSYVLIFFFILFALQEAESQIIELKEQVSPLYFPLSNFSCYVVHKTGWTQYAKWKV